MIQKSFIFDTNKCTGCNACQIACILENKLDYSASWRQVVTFNPDHYPDLTMFHLSMACNHCIDPPCLKYCPASAINKSDNHGTVQIDAEKCIGCKYCSWVCPFDAPDYNSDSGVMEKCTFCVHRLEENLEPACVTLCPTGALETGYLDFAHEQEPVPGLSKTDIVPSISILPRRRNLALPADIKSGFDTETENSFGAGQESRLNKISPKSEWSLIIFSLLTPLIIAAQMTLSANSTELTAAYLIPFTLLSMLISLSHLGVKSRAYRAIINWRSSWISREILFLNLFLLGQIGFLFHPYGLWLCALGGIGLLISMDMVYHVLPRFDQNHWHSSRVIFTAILFAAVFAQNHLLFALILILKFVLYLFRKTYTASWRNMNFMIRVLTGFILPPLLWYATSAQAFHLLIISLLISELIDRIDFYREIKLITPRDQMEKDFQKELSKSL